MFQYTCNKNIWNRKANTGFDENIGIYELISVNWNSKLYFICMII